MCRDLADNKKAENTLVLDVCKLSSVTDFFVIVSGSSQPHLRAIVEEIHSKLRDEQDLRPVRTDGMASGSWVVLDYFDVIVHIMRTDVRAHYDLEGLWGDAPRVAPKRKPRAKTAAKKTPKAATKE